MNRRLGPTGRRVIVAAVLGTATGVSFGHFQRWQVSELAGWDVACIIFLVSTLSAVLFKSAADTSIHAIAEDPGAPLADLVISSAAIACIAGAGLALARASSSSGGTKAALIALAVASVLLSWASVHTIFTLRYARLYYSGGDGGIDFNEDDPPDYRDFAYLALTVGMTFQVSDTNLTAKSVRRTALRHALISWLFGTVLLGMTINVLAGILSGGN